MEILQRAFDEMSAAAALPRVQERAPRFTRADSQFHTGIARAAQNAFLVTAVEETRVRMFIALGAGLRNLFGNAHRGHADVLRAIRRQQPEAAARAMSRHLGTTRDDVGVVLHVDLSR
jgi:DNA-binding GntR family transcriptional regulator